MFAEEVVRGGRDGGEMGREGMSKHVCVVSVLLCNECCIIVDLGGWRGEFRSHDVVTMNGRDFGL